MERTRKQDLVIGLVVLAVGLYGCISALKMPEATKNYTLVVCGIFAFLGGILAGRSIYFKSTPSHDSKKVALKEVIDPFIAFVMIGIYTIAMPKIGFFVCSIVFMLTMMLWMGYRKIHFMVLTTAIMLGFIWVLFVFSLNVPLPSGILF